jgi:hypothetical protein
MNDYQKPGAAKRQSAIRLRTAQKFDLRGLWIFAGVRLIAFRSHSRRLDAYAHEPAQARSCQNSVVRERLCLEIRLERGFMLMFSRT